MEFSNLEASAAAGLAMALGLLLVFVGRRLFWVFVGAIGFFAGMQVAAALAPAQQQWIILVIGIVLGIVGAVLAMLLQRVAVAVAGWFAGGFLASRLALALGWSDQAALVIAFFIGAICVAIIFSLLFDWALIGLTTLTGALMFCDALRLAPSAEWTIAAVLAAAGVLVQARALIKPPEQPAGGRRV